MVTFLFLIIFFGSILYLCRSQKSEKTYTEDSEDDNSADKTYKELSEKIVSLNDRKNKIDTLNDMIADLMSCAPGRVHKTVQIFIPDSQNEYNFLCSGEDEVSQLFLEIFENERESQSASLRSEIKKIG